MKTITGNKTTNGWNKARIGDVLRLINGRAFKPSEWKERGLPIVRIQNLNNTEAPFNYYEGDLPKKFLLNNGDLLFAWSGTPGTSFGAHIWRGGKAWLNQHIFKVMFDDVDFNKRFLQLAINQNLNEYIRAAHGGAGLAHITKGKFEDSELVKPPLEEQKLIVAEIEKQFSRLDEAVDNLKRVKANLKRYKASVLKAAVEGKLTEDWRKQHPDVEPASKLLERTLAERRAKWNRAGYYKEPAAPDTTGLPRLPNNWKWASLDQLLLNITDGDHQPPPQTDSGVPFLVIGNVRSGKLEFEDTRFVSRQYADAVDAFRKPTHDDILYTLVGSFGIALRVDTDREFCIQRHIGVLRSHKLSPTSYLVHVLNSLAVLSQAIKVATGTAQKTVPLAGLRRIAIPLPPLAEQQQIVAEVERRLSVIAELEAAVEANLTRADRLRQAVLSKAFMGALITSL
ncbi:MAG: restriction endonuclease subunit S [Nitrospirae bacterium]|nr:restriction endonuclease subunit S [Nitrospirota bacterium]